jgi:hypothetical protein
MEMSQKAGDFFMPTNQGNQLNSVSSIMAPLAMNLRLSVTGNEGQAGLFLFTEKTQKPTVRTSAFDSFLRGE